MSAPETEPEAETAAGAAGRSWPRPWPALAVAIAGMAVTVVVIAWLPQLHLAVMTWPAWAVAVLDLVVLSAPLAAAVLVAVRVGGSRFAVATGLRGFSWIDLAAGIGVGLVARALVETLVPTVGGFGGGFGIESPDLVAAIVIAAAGAVLVTPLVEELFFRGLLQRALGDALAGAGRIAAGVVAVLVSTAAFTAMHLVSGGGAGLQAGILTGTIAVGLGCGILTLLTGRLAGAVIAHVVYNAIGVALLAW